MVEQVTVEDLYSRPGFEDMIQEYAKLAIKRLPKPLYRKEDYLPLEAAGILTVWCVMYGGVVVGFATCILSRIPHYGIGIAIAESLFVREGVRAAGYGVRLIQTLERHAALNKATALLVSCPLGSEFEKVLKHRNYSAETTTFVKPLWQS